MKGAGGVETSAPGMEGYWLARGDFLIKREPLAASRNRLDSSRGWMERANRHEENAGRSCPPLRIPSLLTSLPGLGHKFRRAAGFFFHLFRAKENASKRA